MQIGDNRKEDAGDRALYLVWFTAFNQAGLGFGRKKAVIPSFFQAVMSPVIDPSAAEQRDRNTC